MRTVTLVGPDTAGGDQVGADKAIGLHGKHGDIVRAGIDDEQPAAVVAEHHRALRAKAAADAEATGGYSAGGGEVAVGGAAVDGHGVARGLIGHHIDAARCACCGDVKLRAGCNCRQKDLATAIWGVLRQYAAGMGGDEGNQQGCQQKCELTSAR